MGYESESNFIFIPPDGGWGWVIVSAVFICNFLVDGTMYSFGVFIFVLKAALGETVGHITIIHAFTFAFYFISGPVVCAFLNRYGFRPVGFLGGLLAGVGYGLSSLYNNLYIIICTNGIIAGIGLSMVFHASNLIVGFYFEKNRSTTTCLAECGSTLGVVTMSPVLAYIMQAYGIKIAYCAIACCMCFTSVLSLTYMPFKPKRVVSYKGMSYSSEDVMSLKSSKFSQLRNRRHICCCPCSSRMSNRHFPTVADVTTNSVSVQNFSYSIRDPEHHRFEQPKTGVRRVLKQWKKYICCYYFRKGTYSRPLYRDDIFYNNHLYVLPENVDSTAQLLMDEKRRSLMYNMSVTRISTKEDFQVKRTSYSIPFARAISTLLDTHIFKSPAFIVYLISGMFLLVGYIIPYTYIMERAVYGKMSKNHSIWLISNLGVASTIGRIFNRGLSAIKKFDPLIYSTVIIIGGGIFSIISGMEYFLHGRAQFVYAFAFGFTCSTLPLRGMISLQLFQIEHLNNVCGLSSVTMGLAAFVGLLVSGGIIDWLTSYNEVFYVAGASYILSGICLPIASIMRKYEKKRGVLYDYLS